MAGLEPATSASQMRNATNCATSISEANERAGYTLLSRGQSSGFHRLLSVASLIVSSRMSKSEVGFVSLPHHKGMESFLIHQS